MKKLTLDQTINNLVELLNARGYEVAVDERHLIYQGVRLGDVHFVKAGGPSDRDGYEAHVMVHAPGTYVADGRGWKLNPAEMARTFAGIATTTPAVAVRRREYDEAVELIASHLAQL